MTALWALGKDVPHQRSSTQQERIAHEESEELDSENMENLLRMVEEIYQLGYYAGIKTGIIGTYDLQVLLGGWCMQSSKSRDLLVPVL